MLTDDVPCLCGEVARDRRLVAVASHPRAARHRRVGAPDRCPPRHTTTHSPRTAQYIAAAATYRITLAHAGYSLYFTMGRDMRPPPRKN